MFIEHIEIPGHGKRPKKAVRLKCDCCGNDFVKDVNVKRWSESTNHRCSVSCFAKDSCVGGVVWEKRRQTCIETYGVPSVVSKPESLATAATKNWTDDCRKRRNETRKKNWDKNSVKLSRGLTIVRSREEIECMEVLSKHLGKCIPQKYMNGWFIDGFFPETNIYVQYDGTFWHSHSGRKEKDAEQDVWFAEQCKTLVRITDLQWKSDMETCIAKCLAVIPPYQG